MRLLRNTLLLSTVLLSGCASSSFSMRTLPAQTPAADNVQAIRREAAINAAAPDPVAANAPPLPLLTMADAPSMYTYDPWERLNRFTYRFNTRFDEHVFLPVADTYRRVPGIVRLGIHNFFSNLTEVPTVVNDTLQWQIRSGVRSLGRFVVNSIAGIGGLIDVASKIHLEKATATFDSTLSRWGMHPGPYLVLPLLGPSTLRESVGLLGDYGISYGIDVVDLYRGYKTYALGVVNAVDTRANTDFRYYATASPFEYETVRFLYVHRILIEDEALHPKNRARKTGTPAPATR